MSMTGRYLKVTPSALAKVIDVPQAAEDLIFPERDNMRECLFPWILVTSLGATGLVAVSLVRGERLLRSEVLPLLALYPVWALVQQLAFQSLLHRGLRVLTSAPVLQVAGTSTAFAAVHFGNTKLVALTLAAGVVWSLLYRRWPNLWLLAGSHTVLAALAYPLVLG